MNVDHLTLACLRDRMDSLLGARVQRVVLPDKRELGLELYAGERVQLLMSAQSQYPRMLIVPQKLRRGVEKPTPLLQLSRKWIRGSHLVDVTQPPWERILELHFDGPQGTCRLVVELIGRYSNIILVDDEGVVMDAAKRIGPDQNRYRVTLPAHTYEPPPPPPGRRSPLGLSRQDWAAVLASAEEDDPLSRVLIRQFLAISPMVGREIAARCTGDPNAPITAVAPADALRVVSGLFAPLDDGAWAPHVAFDEQGNVAAFAPYEPMQFKHRERVSTISEAMWRYFRQRLTADAYAVARRRVAEQVDEARSRTKRALDQVRKRRVNQEDIDALREAGELILAYQHQIEPGAEDITVPGFDGESRTLDLDPELSPVENAQRYFDRYRKAQRAAEEIPLRVQELRTDLSYLNQLATDVAMAETRPEIDAVHEALVEGGWAPADRRPPSGRVAEPRRFDVDGFPVFVGRNARQNEQVTFERGGSDDLWLHVRGRSGAHVIIKSGHRDVPDEVVRRAAQLAAYYSSARGAGQAPVDVTERYNVRRVTGQRPGVVTYRDERTLIVDVPKQVDHEGAS